MPLTITYLGHSGFLFSDGSTTVAVDPFLTGNPKATMKAADVKCNAIVLTHGHADHFGDTVEIAKKNKATLYGAFELCNFAQSKGVESAEPMNPGGRVKAPWGWVALTQAFHSSSYDADGKTVYTGQPCGAMINLGGVTIYHAGDTGLFSDMKLLGEIYQPTIACLPIGDRFTMGPELATKAAEFVKPKFAIPIHYNTWPPIEQDPKTFNPQGVEVKVMQPGETWKM